MWAQQIRLRMRPGTEEQLGAIVELLRATEQPESGLVRELVMRDQRDPTLMYVLTVFESEE
jgi:quinol monooxygenase YgiN